MQDTSALWKEMVRDPNARREYRVDIAGVSYGPEDEVEQRVTGGLFEAFSIGGAACALLRVSLAAPGAEIPAGAEIRRYVRLNDGSRRSEWLPKGVFFVTSRRREDGRWDLEACDAMARGEREWVPDQDLDFPLPMTAAAAILAGELGVPLDPRTELDPAYTVDYPAGYTIRQELGYIAAAHGGNWVITDRGELLLVPVPSAPPETDHLVTEQGDAITFGGVRILV